MARRGGCTSMARSIRAGSGRPFTPRFDSIQHAAIGSALTSGGAQLARRVLQRRHRRSPDLGSRVIAGGASSQYQSSRSRARSNLVARWGFNEGGSTAVNDSTPSPVNGVITGPTMPGRRLEHPSTWSSRPPIRCWSVPATLRPIASAGDSTANAAATATLLDEYSGHDLHAGRQRLRRRHGGAVRELLRPDVGSPGDQGADAADHRESRLPHGQRHALLRLLQRRRRARQPARPAIARPAATTATTSGTGTSWSSTASAPRTASRIWEDVNGCAAGFHPGAVAAGRSGGEPDEQHHRDVAPAALQLEQLRHDARVSAAAVAGAVRVRRGYHARRPLAQLRAAGADERGRRDATRRSASARSSWERAGSGLTGFATTRPDQRGAECHDPRRHEVHAARHDLRLAVHSSRRRGRAHGLRNGHGARRARQPAAGRGCGAGSNGPVRRGVPERQS